MYCNIFPRKVIEVAFRGRPFDSWGGGEGYGFFCEKKIVQ